MTALSLVLAVAVGAAVGVTGRVLAFRDRVVPLWLPIAAGVAAAVLASVVAPVPGQAVIAVALQALFAAAAVTVVATTADRLR